MALVLDAGKKLQWSRVLLALKSGQPVAIPTETVYGLAARADSEKALGKIFALKNRPQFDPLILHVHSRAQLDSWVQRVSLSEEKLFLNFWPGPLTALLKKSDRVPDLCTAGSEWVAVRCPQHRIFRKAIRDLDLPLAAPSANRFSGLSPTSVEDVLKELGPWGLEVVVSGDRCFHGLESTVLRVDEDNKKILIHRAGALPVEQIQVVLPDFEIVYSDSQASPGNIKKHYAPKKPLIFVESKDRDKSHIESEIKKTFESSLRWTYFYVLGEEKLMNFDPVLCLSPTNSLQEAAVGLFSNLRLLDENSEVGGIVAFATREEGLGRAINDRLRRASSAIIS